MSYQFPVLDLFSGIGGFSLGLERTGGFKTVAFCETESFPRAVLEKHWPLVPKFGDIRELSAEDFHTYGIEPPKVICGGFPCQDISPAGRGAGLAGARSGLWFEYRRLIKEIRPSWAIIENVSALRTRGLDEVLRSLAEIGYDAEWHCIPASAVDAPHERDRVWIVAYPEGPERTRLWPEQGWSQKRFTNRRRWAAEPAVGRVANGVPRRVDRIEGLGNAVVPQIPEMIGQAILEWELMC